MTAEYLSFSVGEILQTGILLVRRNSRSASRDPRVEACT